MIQVKFSCKVCGKLEQLVDVPNRKPNEDLMFWMNEVCMQVVKAKHYIISPECTATNVDLMIPFENDKPLGSKV